MARILQIATHYREPGGEDAVAAAEARLLAGAGHEVLRTAPGMHATTSRPAHSLRFPLGTHGQRGT